MLIIRFCTFSIWISKIKSGVVYMRFSNTRLSWYTVCKEITWFFWHNLDLLWYTRTKKHLTNIITPLYNRSRKWSILFGYKNSLSTVIIHIINNPHNQFYWSIIFYSALEKKNSFFLYLWLSLYLFLSLFLFLFLCLDLNLTEISITRFRISP